MALVLATTLALGCLLTRDFDWMTWLEATNLIELGVLDDHASIAEIQRVAAAMCAWLVFNIVTLIVVQGLWGITPGKWVCRLRTVRSTLQPCGLARSLVREIVMFVDCCNFVCWTPGIVSVALTDHRQRLGDLVADSVVVNVRTLKGGAKEIV